MLWSPHHGSDDHVFSVLAAANQRWLIVRYWINFISLAKVRLVQFHLVSYSLVIFLNVILRKCVTNCHPICRFVPQHTVLRAALSISMAVTKRNSRSFTTLTLVRIVLFKSPFQRITVISGPGKRGIYFWIIYVSTPGKKPVALKVSSKQNGWVKIHRDKTLVNSTRRVYSQINTRIICASLQWRHNECDGVSNQRRLHCLLNCWFRRRSQKTSKLRVTGLCAGNSPVTGEFPAQKASDAENISIWWRHQINPK